MGLETGDDDLLKYMRKGVTSAKMIEAANMVKRAGIDLSVTIIQGLGGKGSWKRNAELTAKVLNEMKPQETRLHALVIHPNSPLYEKVRTGEFVEATREEVLREMRELISRLTYETRVYTYSSGYIKPGLIDGELPNDKDYMLDMLDYILETGEEIFLQKWRYI
jgi:radical SAM superfamily enzyme YgiQ (UPF0313 family)